MPLPNANRRQLLRAAAGAAFALKAGASFGADGSDAPRLRAAVIGDTRHGDYGHGLDVVFNGVPGVEVVAVADRDESGRAAAASRCKAPRQYADFREMLDKERPDLVSVAPRWSERHHAMASAAIAAGAHVLTEKPITPTLTEAHDLIARADKARRKVAVAHQMQVAPIILSLKHALDAGELGELLRVDAHGKQDSRAGGEDLLVLGSHLFGLMRLFAGDARWCTARVLQDGRDITAGDAREVKERIGPVAGDEATAQFAFDGGVNGTFTSRARLREVVGHWGLVLIGTKMSARVLADITPRVLVARSAGPSDLGRAEDWRPFDPARSGAEPRPGAGEAAANRRVVDDWLDAIRRDREPACSARAATKSLEMIMAVYHAALTGARVPLPLKERRHPLEGR